MSINSKHLKKQKKNKKKTKKTKKYQGETRPLIFYLIRIISEKNLNKELLK